jgi:cytochrome P450/ubiquinone/menaquinone biosynthesis C-methylase UbiE
VFPPGPRSRIPGRLELQYLRDPLGFLRDLSTYGDIVHFRFRATDIYLVTDPELIQQALAADHRVFVKGASMQQTERILGNGLLTSEGEFHHSQRRLIQPALHKARVEALGDSMVELAERRATEWRDGETRNMHVELSRLTIEIVAKTLFSVDLSRDSGEIVAALHETVSVIARLALPFGPLWERSPLPSARRFEAGVERLHRATAEILERRRALGDVDDAMSHLLRAQQGNNGDGLSDRQVRDEAMTLLLAGHETTASTLTWALYLLSQHPEVERRVRDELATVIGDRDATTEDADALEYTSGVLHEALRLYPPVWGMPRRTIAPYELDGYSIPTGSIVAFNQWVMHHDPRFWPDPFAFDPTRWTNKAQESRPRYAFFPFGGGPRICLGPAFAMLESQLVLATLLRHWRFRLADGQRVEIAPVLTLRPRYGMHMELEQADRALRRRPLRATARDDDFWAAAVELWAAGDQRIWRRHSDSVNSRLLQRWLPQDLGRVLKTDLWDEAVGEGVYSSLAARAETTIGVDVSHSVVEAASSRHPGLVSTRADVRTLPFGDALFDAVVSNSTLDHFDSTVDILEALREFRRVLRPGGLLVLTLDNPANPFVALTRALPRGRLNRLWLAHAGRASRLGLLPYYVGVTVGRTRLCELLRTAGFDVREVTAIMHAPRPLAILAGALIERRGSTRLGERLGRLFEALERLERSPVRFRSGHFTAVLARRP